MAIPTDIVCKNFRLLNNQMHAQTYVFSAIAQIEPYMIYE